MRAEVARDARDAAGAVDDHIDVEEPRTRSACSASSSERATGNHARDSTSQSVGWNEHSRGMAHAILPERDGSR